MPLDAHAPVSRDRAAALLSRLRDDLASLCALVEERQPSLADAGAPDALAFLARRGELFSRVERARRLCERAGVIDPGGNDQPVLREIADFARRVIARDRSDDPVLRARRDDLARRLGGIEQGRRAASAYSVRAEPAPRLQDQEC
jgi:hypothetical protein